VDANKSLTACQRPSACARDWLRDANVRWKFNLRQGLWIEDLRIPPGQECSNGSLILLAVVLWRAFFPQGPSAVAHYLRYEINKD